jgi:uncharacterized membrane protein YvlD (DUF360 family)
MIRFLIRTAVMLGANALALWIASLLLDDMSIDAGAFIVAVLIFTAVEVLASPLLTRQAMRNAQALQGATALIATLIGLVVTDLISDGLSISGVSTYLLAMIIVWLVAMAAGAILTALFVKKRVVEKR